MFFLVVRNLYWQPWSLCYQLPKPCWEKAGSLQQVQLGKSRCVPVEEKSKAFWRNLAGQASWSPPSQMTKSWSCETLSLERHKCNRNRKNVVWSCPQEYWALVVILCDICPLSQSYKNWDPKAVEAKKDHPHCYWFLRRTPCLPWGCYWSRWDFWEQRVVCPHCLPYHLNKTGINNY